MRGAECRMRNAPVQGPNARPKSWRSRPPMNRGGKAESGKRKAKTRESSSFSCSSLVLDRRRRWDDGFKAPMCVQTLEVEALHEPPHLVGADVRRLTL